MLLSWLLTLEKFGIAIITDAPLEEGSVRRFAQRVGPMKPTHYEYGLHSFYSVNLAHVKCVWLLIMVIDSRWQFQHHAISYRIFRCLSLTVIRVTAHHSIGTAFSIIPGVLLYIKYTGTYVLQRNVFNKNEA